MFLGPALAQPQPPAIRWRLATAGSDLVVDLVEIKVFVNRPVEDTWFDAELTRMAKVAQRAIEQNLQGVLAYSTWTGTLPGFWDRVTMFLRPFGAVTKLEYVAPDTGEITELPAEAADSVWHWLPTSQDTGTIFLGEGQSWPAIARRHDAVRITATAGYAVTSEDEDAGAPPLPDEIRHALLMTIAALDSTHGDSAGQGGGATTVYAMKQARGAGLISPEASRLLAPYVYRSVTVA